MVEGLKGGRRKAEDGGRKTEDGPRGRVIFNAKSRRRKRAGKREIRIELKA